MKHQTLFVSIYAEHTRVSTQQDIKEHTPLLEERNIKQVITSSIESQTASSKNKIFASESSIITETSTPETAPASTNNEEWRLIAIIGTVCVISLLCNTLIVIGVLLFKKHNKKRHKNEGIPYWTTEPDAQSAIASGKQKNTTTLQISAQLEEDPVYESIPEVYSYINNFSQSSNEAYGITSCEQDNISFVENEAYSTVSCELGDYEELPA